MGTVSGHRLLVQCAYGFSGIIIAVILLVPFLCAAHGLPVRRTTWEVWRDMLFFWRWFQ